MREWRTDGAGLAGGRYVEEAEAAHADAPRGHLQGRVVALVEREDLRNLTTASAIARTQHATTHARTHALNTHGKRHDSTRTLEAL
jgi:hypothetical protein